MDKFLKKIAWLVIAAPVIYLAITWKQIPEQVAMHYDLYGNPDRYGNKKELIGLAAIMTAVSLFVYFLLVNIYRIDPKKQAAENKERLNRIAFAVVVFMSGLSSLIIYNSTRGNVKFSMGVVFAAIGLLLAVIGNYMPNLKPNYFAGFRVPWTLKNEENWRKTHALAGRLWFGGGLFLAIICLFLPPVAAIVIFLIVILIITVIPFVHSYRLYKKKKRVE